MQPDSTALPWVLPRARLATLLEQRWTYRVVVMVAGAGFGKSTALALATADETDERRKDHHIRLDASCASAAELMRRLGEAVGSALPDVAADEPRALAEDLARTGLEHCLIFDDLHEVEETSAGIAQLRDLLDALHPNVHVVLASRTKPPIPLARRRAAGFVLDLDESDLAYTHEELSGIAELTGVPASELSESGGWPALVSLTVRQGHRGALDFLVEEVLSGLDADVVSALHVACLTGGADGELLRRVAGYEGDLAAIARTVPLVTIDGVGRLVPHALWTPALESAVGGAETQRALHGIADALRARGDHAGALQIGLRLSDPSTIADIVREICAPGHIGFDLDDIDRWLRQAPLSFLDEPEGRLLAAVAALQREPVADTTKAALADCAAELRSIQQVDGEIVALSGLALAMRWRGEADELAGIVGRLFELDAAGHPAAAALTTFARAALADHLGDTSGALATIDGLRRGDLHDSWIAYVEFLRCHLLLLLGRPREARNAAVRSMELGPPGYVGGWCAERSAAWHLGVTRERVDRLPIADDVTGSSIVDQLWIGTWFGAMQAFAGRREDAARNVAAAERALRSNTQPELIGFVAWARAALAVADHDLDAARDIVAEYLGRCPIESSLGARFASRAPAMVDLLIGEELPEGWNEHLTGPWQRSMLSIAGALRALRSGSVPDTWADPGLVLCALPIPWAIEFAVRGHLAGQRPATDLARHILDVAGPEVVVEEIDRWLPPDLRLAARELFTSGRPPAPTRVRLLGAVGLTGGSGIEGAAELRRRRVRELLACIALAGPVRREFVADALWPELDQDRSAANLRVNLSYLMRIRTSDGQRLIVESAKGLELASDIPCDVWEFERLVADAAAAHHAGSEPVALALYRQALGVVDGPPLTDTQRPDWFVHQADRLTVAVVRAATQAAALARRLGQPVMAIESARRAVELDPFHEDGWVELIHAYRAAGDEVGASTAATTLRRQLAALGIEPSATTASLL